MRNGSYLHTPEDCGTHDIDIDGECDGCGKPAIEVVEEAQAEAVARAVKAERTRAVAVLNRALAADRNAVEKLIEHRVRCNQALLEDPTIQCSNACRGPGWMSEQPRPMVGMLGILNGIFGVDEKGWGHIAAEYEDGSGRLLRFVER